ncbi:MAG: flagellar hook capping FlgD N-terminal domain-containing protein [Ilumatobacter sp.]|uniref:flagellar hook capping FlgD N-terminal domain-containing protein n=1 Tax=Ilumatobacter sp. TaxID=1967498 RepID=UPI00261639C2|nr:flagellar hook capping FlgD N-terminal domain-containing protein [Ilumatobacter sp.]MDJ0767463.1 flagellar hook capping FlgD N-terminal domain-containing protein [Ilumatobacter sp.]
MSDTSPIAPVGASPTTPEPPGQPVENPGALLDRDAFLKLLVAQLKYQDPTKPVDASQMVAQSAQLTMVDRLNEIASTLDATAASNRWSLAGGLVGKDVTFEDEDGTLRIERVTSVRVDGDDLVLSAGAFSVPLAAVESVHTAEVPPTTSTATAPSATPTAPIPTATTPTTDIAPAAQTEPTASDDTASAPDTTSTPSDDATVTSGPAAPTGTADATAASDGTDATSTPSTPSDDATVTSGPAAPTGTTDTTAASGGTDTTSESTVQA